MQVKINDWLGVGMQVKIHVCPLGMQVKINDWLPRNSSEDQWLAAEECKLGSMIGCLGMQVKINDLLLRFSPGTYAILVSRQV